LICIVLIILGLSLIVLFERSLSLTGLFVFEEIAPEGFNFTYQGEVSETAALQAIQDAQLEIAVMRQNNLTTIFVEDVLNEANLQYGQGNYTVVLKMAQLISFIKKEKIEFLDRLELIKDKELEFQTKKVDTYAGQALIQQSRKAFVNDQLKEAQALLEQADAELGKANAEKERQKGLAYLSKNFFLKYWWQIILVMCILSVVSPYLAKRIIKKRRQQKLARLREELGQTQELIKKLQRDCFIEKKISTETYKKKAVRYEERMAEIKHTIPVIEAQLRGKSWFSKKSEKRADQAQLNKKKTLGVLEIK